MIDILLATYQGEKYLKEQLDSLFSQTCQNFHLYIRDDGSTDNTSRIISEAMNEYPDKISVIEDGDHVGAIESFSRLLSASKSPYIMFSDQDDIWMNGKVQKSLEKIQMMEGCFGNDIPLLVHSDLKVVNETLQEISPSFCTYTNLKPKEGSRLNRFLVQNEITGCTILMNRVLADLAKPIFPQCVMHDWWLGLVAAAFGHIGFINEPLILYRQHGKNTLGAKKFSLTIIRPTKNNSKKNAQALEMLQRYRNFLLPKQISMLEDYVSMKNNSIIQNRYLTLKHGFFKQGLLRNLYSFLLLRHP